jgi:hypothetical protein
VQHVYQHDLTDHPPSNWSVLRQISPSAWCCERFFVEGKRGGFRMDSRHWNHGLLCIPSSATSLAAKEGVDSPCDR